MEPDSAKEIIRSLADGRDPATGAQFPPDSPYQQAETVRALHMALEAMQGGQPRQERPVDPNRPQIGKNWTREEEDRLVTAFKARKPIPEIATAHGRTTGGITARLVKLGLIEDTMPNRPGVSRRSNAETDQGNRPPRPLSHNTPQSDEPPLVEPPEEHEELPF
jgi:hypothetical protein